MANSILWGDTLKVNVGEIDTQHEKLISIMSRLHESFNAKTHGDTEKKILVELIDYTRYHFGTEKKLMEDNDYDERQSHLEQHKEFVTKLASLCEKHQVQNMEVSREVLAFLTSWIINHILETDKKLARFLIEKGGQ